MLPRQIDHIIFDMDGTLTQATHDYDELRQLVGAPDNTDTLAYVEQQPNRGELMQRIYDWEMEHARIATANDGAHALLTQLRQQDVQLGVLTRNAKALTAVTLEAAGLAEFFTPQTLISRDDCAAKPDPAGIEILASYWRCQPAQMAIVGDYLHDIAAGRHAGITTVLLRADNPWLDQCDYHIHSLKALMQ